MDEKHKTTVHMFNLNASHGGDYECLIKYSDSIEHNETVIKVIVTGKNVLNLKLNTVFHSLTLRCQLELPTLLGCGAICIYLHFHREILRKVLKSERTILHLIFLCFC